MTARPLARLAVAALIMIGAVASAVAAPTATAPVDDRAGVLSAQAIAELTTELAELRDRDDTALGLVIVDRTAPDTIEALARREAVRFADGRTRAAVMVLAIGDRQSRLEVSEALRPTFPDARAKLILDNVRGYLRDGDHAGALHAVIREVRGAVRGEPIDLESPHPGVSDPAGAAPPTEATAPASHRRRWFILAAVVAVLLAGGSLWARSARASTATWSHAGDVDRRRAFWIDALWHTAKIIGWVAVILFVVLASGSSKSSSRSWSSRSSSRSSSSSSRSSRSSSRSSTSSSRPSGWRGGGASSGW